MNSIIRAFDILERFRHVRRPLSLKDLVAEFGYPSSSIADILKTLSQAGYISFDPLSRSYFPTTRLAELGSWIMSEFLADSPPVEIMKNLRRATGDTVLLGTQNDLEVLYLVVLEAAQAVPSMTSGRRTPRPLIKSGVGLALLSVKDDGFIERIYRRSVARGMFDQRDLPLGNVMTKVDACRRDGYVFIKDWLNPNAAIVAMAVPGLHHGHRLAIGVGGPTERLEPRLRPIAETMLFEVRALA
jgi:IclR family KDG regulon transcriptional repressor